MTPGHRTAKRLISSVATLALVSLVLLHQVFAGVFVGGTVLCIGGDGGFAVQPVGMTCCATHAAGTATAADPCCDEDAPACPTATTPACHGCTDYLLTVQIALPASDAPVALPPSSLVVIGLLDWPDVSAERLVNDQWVDDRTPPPLAFLRTVILRC